MSILHEEPNSQMADDRTGSGGPPTASSAEPVDAGPVDVDQLPQVSAPRPALWLLLVPVLLYCLAPVVADRIEPRILGIPFLLAYIGAVTIVTPLVIWLVSRLDPVFRAGAAEPVPAEDLVPADPADPAEPQRSDDQ
jgi:hypothetical protein